VAVAVAVESLHPISYIFMAAGFGPLICSDRCFTINLAGCGDKITYKTMLYHSLTLLCLMMMMMLMIHTTSLVTATAKMDRVEIDFDIKPNGQRNTAKASLPTANGEIGCSFTYAAVGGTNEQWLIEIEEQNSKYFCTIRRPDQFSYLYFQHFSASLTGAPLVRAALYDNHARVADAEWKIEGGTVSNSDKFSHAITKLEISN